MATPRELAGCRIVAEHRNRAPCGADQAQHQLHQRGLAGAIVADQRHRLPSAEFKGDVGYRGDAPVVLRYVADGNRRVHGALPAALRRAGGDMSGWLSITPPGSSAGNCAWAQRITGTAVLLIRTLAAGAVHNTRSMRSFGRYAASATPSPLRSKAGLP